MVGILLFSVKNESQRQREAPTMTTLVSPTVEHNLIPLCDLEERAEAVIQVTDLDDDEREMLAAMGLHEEATFRLCQQGQPCIIQIEATRLGLSREVTSRILVRRCDECSIS